MLSTKEYAKQYGVDKRTVENWIKKGYIRTGENDQIPDDMPCPVKNKNNNIKQIHLLWLEFLNAADERKSVFHSMYKNIDQKTFNDELNRLVNEKYIDLIPNQYGISHLTITPEGYKFKKAIEEDKDKAKQIFDNLKDAISTTGTIISIVEAISKISV